LRLLCRSFWSPLPLFKQLHRKMKLLILHWIFSFSFIRYDMCLIRTFHISQLTNIWQICKNLNSSKNHIDMYSCYIDNSRCVWICVHSFTHHFSHLFGLYRENNKRENNELSFTREEILFWKNVVLLRIGQTLV